MHLLVLIADSTSKLRRINWYLSSHTSFLGRTISLMIIIRVRETKKILWLNVQGASSNDASFLRPSTAHTGCTTSMKFRQLLPLIPQYLLLTKNRLLQESQRGAIVTGIRTGQTGRLRTLITSRTTLLRIFPVSTTKLLKMGDKMKSLT